MERELAILRSLCRAYGTHRLGKYFGFTLKEMAQKMGVTQARFSKMIKLGIPEKYHSRFDGIFAEMKIEERTKDFKESGSQKLTRELYQNVKNI